MQSKISLQWSLFIIGIAGIIFSLLIHFFLNDIQPIESVPSPIFPEPTSLTPVTRIISGLPIRLKIPKIGVDSIVTYVGLTPYGAMDVPKNPADVAWFNLGPRPGDTGSAVVSGHYGWKDDIPAVFDNLYKLHKGDELYVEDEKGATSTFVVRELRTFGQNEEASSVFGSKDGKAHLNLITCEGIWSSTQKSYSQRLVVFTDKEINK